MHVRLLTGRYAGEIRDVRSDAARQMLADGRAADPDSAVGGIVDAEPLLVGEVVHDHFIPAATAARMKTRRRNG
jgi:hypothetical protein